MPNLQPIDEKTERRLKGGHKVYRSVVEMFQPYCAFCKAPPWESYGTNDYAAALKALEDHCWTNHPAEMERLHGSR